MFFSQHSSSSTPFPAGFPFGQSTATSEPSPPNTFLDLQPNTSLDSQPVPQRKRKPRQKRTARQKNVIRPAKAGSFPQFDAESVAIKELPANYKTLMKTQSVSFVSRPPLGEKCETSSLRSGSSHASGLSVLNYLLPEHQPSVSQILQNLIVIIKCIPTGCSFNHYVIFKVVIEEIDERELMMLKARQRVAAPTTKAPRKPLSPAKDIASHLAGTKRMNRRTKQEPSKRLFTVVQVVDYECEICGHVKTTDEIM